MQARRVPPSSVPQSAARQRPSALLHGSPGVLLHEAVAERQRVRPPDGHHPTGRPLQGAGRRAALCRPTRHCESLSPHVRLLRVSTHPHPPAGLRRRHRVRPAPPAHPAAHGQLPPGPRGAPLPARHLPVPSLPYSRAAAPHARLLPAWPHLCNPRSRGLQPRRRRDLKPLHVVQPSGPSFTVDGWSVRWEARTPSADQTTRPPTFAGPLLRPEPIADSAPPCCNHHPPRNGPSPSRSTGGRGSSSTTCPSTTPPRAADGPSSTALRSSRWRRARSPAFSSHPSSAPQLAAPASAHPLR